MKSRYTALSALATGKSRWITPIRVGYLMQCCDCALVHVCKFRINRGRIQFRVSRDNRKTAACRREEHKRRGR